ncbi:hypothetical protein SAMD00019534_118960, partial [Acytostelium subglobosum LB1]|uniref:hypothetical protein n=1 Tax=Acytostelium subglobosum LB1 TaxID=1410327 RepID=UPI000645221F
MNMLSKCNRALLWWSTRGPSSSSTMLVTASNSNNAMYIPSRSMMVIMKKYTPNTDPKRHMLEELEYQQQLLKERAQIQNPPKYKRSVRNYNITPPDYAEVDLTMKEPPSMEGQKRLNVAVIGAPNAGKSSLVNTIVGEKVCAVSSREHTTRDDIIGIFTKDKTQIVFHDTPGIMQHFERKSKIREFVNLAWSVVKESDLVLLVVDASHDNQGDTNHILVQLERQMIELLKEMKDYNQQSATKEFILVINKVDLVTEREDLLEMISKLNESNIFSDTFLTSATNGIHVNTLTDFLLTKAMDGKWEFNDELKTDQTDIFRASEIIKEKMYEKLRQEIPYEVTQNTIGWTKFNNGDLRIDQDLIVKKNSHKSTILGKDGVTIKSIYLEAKKDLERVFNRRVHLFLAVKVKQSE